MIKTEGWFTDFSRLYYISWWAGTILWTPSCTAPLGDMLAARQVTPWAHCNSAGLFSTVFVVAHFYSWIVSNEASFPDCSLFTNSYFFWKKQMTLDYLFFFHLGKGAALAPWVFGTVLNRTLSSFLSLDFCTCCVLYMECFALDKCISSYFLSFRCQLKCHFFYLKEHSPF